MSVYIYYLMKNEMLHVNVFIRCILCTIFCVMCKTDFARTCESQVCRALEWINVNEKWKKFAKWLNRPVVFTLNTNINFLLTEQKSMRNRWRPLWLFLCSHPNRSIDCYEKWRSGKFDEGWRHPGCAPWLDEVLPVSCRLYIHVKGNRDTLL